MGDQDYRRHRRSFGQLHGRCSAIMIRLARILTISLPKFAGLAHETKFIVH